MIKIIYKNNIKIFCASFVICFVFVLCLTSVALAQESPYDVMIAPHTFELNVKKGETLEKAIKILNKGSVDVPMKAKVIDFTAEDETGKMVFGPGGGDIVSSAKWIEIKKSDFILSPQETYRLDFEIKIPAETTPGGYYATVIFEPQLPSVYFGKDKSRAIPEIGALILFAVDIEGRKRGNEVVSVTKFGIPEKYHLKKLENALGRIIGIPGEAMAAEKGGFSVVENSSFSFDVRIKNEDVFHNKFFGKLEVVSNDEKKVLGRAEVQRITILPEKSRSFPVEFDPEPIKGFWGSLPFGILNFIKENFTWGKYKARLTLFQENPNGISIAPGAENVKTEETIEFWIFPWKTIIFIIFLIIILILFRKRIKNAMKVLFQKHKTRQIREPLKDNRSAVALSIAG